MLPKSKPFPSLTTINGEPHMSDVDLARMLGMSVRKLRRLIEKNRAALEALGPLHTRPSEKPPALPPAPRLH